MDPVALFPRVFYKCTPDLLLTSISPNAHELLGICPGSVMDNRSLWEERFLAEDRIRMLEKLARLGSTETATEAHKISDDQGLPVWVLHHFRKIKSSGEADIFGCMSPLGTEFFGKALDASTILQFVHKIGNHFQLINLLVGSLKRTSTRLDEIEALQQTIDRAVEFTRSFAHYSQPPVCPSVVDLGEILQTVTAAAAGACAEKKVIIQNLVPTSFMGASVSGDPFLLQLAFTAVLENAMEATRNGDQICVAANMTEGPAPRPIAHITIVDTGCGIENAALPAAAAPFVTSKRDRDGLGLSMAIRVIEMHGGTLKILSAAGKGTRVLIALPVEFNPTKANR